MKKKVIFIHHGSVPGGAPTSLRNTLIELKNHNAYDIEIFCFYSSMLSYFRETNLPVTTLGVPPPQVIGRILIGYARFVPITFYCLIKEIFSFHYYFKLYRYLKNKSPDLIHLNSSVLVIVAIIAKFCKIPLVWHIRENPKNYIFGFNKVFAGWLIRNLANQVVCISELEAKSFGFDTLNNANIIYNSVDFRSFHSEAKSDGQFSKELLNIPKDAFLLATLGGCSPHKGIDQLLEMMPYLDSHIHLLVAGSVLTPLESANSYRIHKIIWCLEDLLIRCKVRDRRLWFYDDRVRYLISKLGPSFSQVHLLDNVDDVVPLLDSIDLLLFAGTFPHFPRPVYEAWTMCKPVLVLDVDGIRNHIDRNVDGLVAPVYDPLAIAKIVNESAKNNNLKKLGIRGRIKAESHFSVTLNTEKLISVYNRIPGMNSCI